jgi:hypothetical protein
MRNGVHDLLGILLAGLEGEDLEGGFGRGGGVGEVEGEQVLAGEGWARIHKDIICD